MQHDGGKRKGILTGKLFREAVAGAAAFVVFIAFAVAALPVHAQTGKPLQTVENDYSFANSAPAWADGSGPVVTVHRLVSPYVQRGALVPFSNLVRSDGFRFNWLDKPITRELLDETDIFVVANPYLKGGSLDYQNFTVLDAPSVYTPEEIAIIRQWVEDGGSLLVLADHSPFAGGAIKLLEAFGYISMTGFAIHSDTNPDHAYMDIDFHKNKTGKFVGKLADHPITDGSTGRPPIEHFYAFGGQAIIPSPEATVLMTIPANYSTLLTYAFWQDLQTAERIDSAGFAQGAAESVGNGRIAVFGETGGFTAQQNDSSGVFGLSAPQADQNADFVLSVLRWLVKFKP